MILNIFFKIILASPTLTHKRCLRTQSRRQHQNSQSMSVAKPCTHPSHAQSSAPALRDLSSSLDSMLSTTSTLVESDQSEGEWEEKMEKEKKGDSITETDLNSDCCSLLPLRAGATTPLPPDLCLLILTKYLILPDALSLALTCRFWQRNFQNDFIFRHAAKSRFRITPSQDQLQIRMIHDVGEVGWKDVYKRLDEGRTAWKGWACDRATNGYKPYSMEVAFNASWRGEGRESGLVRTGVEGVCRWRTLRDSLTRVGALCIFFDPRRTQPKFHKFPFSSFSH